MKNRFKKINFVADLIKNLNDPQAKKYWITIEKSLKKLDFWIEQRNHIIHNAEGWSKDNLAKELENARKNHRTKNQDNVKNACQSNQILMKMTNIISQTRNLLGLSESNYVGLNKPYYIYSQVKDWVIKQLDEFGNQ